MTQPNAQDILAVLCAPALVCTAAGPVLAMNRGAADWLETSSLAAAGQSVGELLCTPSESLVGFLQRTQRHGQALCKGYAYRPTNRSRRSAMVCHAQRLKGLQQSGCLLLIFTAASPVEAHDACTAGCSTRANTGISSRKNTVNADEIAQSADVNGMSALSDVALGLVHEVNQPLTAIATYAHSCRRWLSAGDNHHPKLLPTVDKIIEQAHVTGHMISSLKGLVRGHDDERRSCDLNQLVHESLELLALDPRFERCRVESQLETDICPVLVSSAQIKIVLLNLLRNALEACLATDAGESRLSVSVSKAEDTWVSATVSDSGVGISPEAGEKMFEPFVTSKSSGLGLGLVISRYLANAHEGRIEYQPDVAKGASFQLLLPLVR